MTPAKPTFRELIVDASRCPKRYLAGFAGRWLGAPSRFLVLCTSRTGSELLVSLLNAHPEVVCDSEILAHEVLFPRRFIEGRAVRARRDGARAYGFKLQINQLHDVQRLGDPREYLAGLHTRGAKIYRLRRHNLLKQVLSFARAKWSVTHIARGETHPLPDKVTADPASLIAGLVHTESLERTADDLLLGIPHTTLFYEDDLADRPSQQRTVSRIFDELGVSAFETEPVLLATSPRRLRDALANYELIASVVGQTRFAKYLDE